MSFKVNTFYTSDDLKEYTFIIKSGGVFISIHAENKKVASIYLEASNLNDIRLQEFRRNAEAFLKTNFKNCELKMIGMIQSINKCTKIFLDNQFSLVKRIIRENDVEIIFTPSQGRIRVAKEFSSEVKPAGKTKVLIVDDSKTIRNILQKIFSQDPNLEVIGSLERPSEVEPFILKNRPDVITLDIHMPEMDGVSLLKKIYPKFKIPTVMISSISLAEGPMVFDALENGAVDYIQKPEAKDIADLTPIIIEKIKLAASVKTQAKKVQEAGVKVKSKSSQDSLVVIGSSTGGTEALRAILTALPDQIPPILIVQHIPAVFSLAFAKRMNDLCSFEVIEATNGDEVKPNRVLIAPGGKQMKLVNKNGKQFVEINDDAPVNRFKPSVDYLFESVVKNMYCHTIAVMLTGMGKDGAREMLNLKKNGAVTIAQNEETCVVFGMPREAIAVGAVDFVEPLQNIAERITSCSNNSMYKKVGNL